ncbi:MAG TPA: transcriptional repressor, partial [Campylobacterales bacterium]|nr:transcriptional repressor [Campylobacterales bacterium]
DHLVCTECGKIEEFMDDFIEKRQELIAKQHNFKMTDHIMKIVGVCEACQKKQK